MVIYVLGFFVNKILKKRLAYWEVSLCENVYKNYFLDFFVLFLVFTKELFLVNDLYISEKGAALILPEIDFAKLRAAKFASKSALSFSCLIAMFQFCMGSQCLPLEFFQMK